MPAAPQFEPSPGRRSIWWPRLVLLVPFAACLWVPSYNAIEPSLGGFPFFYWYQLLWVLITAIAVGAIYLIEG